MKKINLKHNKKPQHKSAEKRSKAVGKVDETTLRMTWLAEIAVCVLVSLSAFVVAMVY